jgi:hypothetical protein
MTFDLSAHIRRQASKTAAEMIKEACLLISRCQDAHSRALAMIELRRMQALLR